MTWAGFGAQYLNTTPQHATPVLSSHRHRQSTAQDLNGLGGRVIGWPAAHENDICIPKARKGAIVGEDALGSMGPERDTNGKE